jgi:hypothetical protein
MQFTYCDDCDKRGYFTRKVARQAARSRHHGDKGLRPYECPAGTGLWHLGHMPSAVRNRGILSAAEAAANKRRRAAS